MDEKMNSVLKDIYDSLTDVQKEKAKNIKTMEELTEFAAKEGIELTDDVLEAVNGGYIVDDASCELLCVSHMCGDHHCDYTWHGGC